LEIGLSNRLKKSLELNLNHLRKVINVFSMNLQTSFLTILSAGVFSLSSCVPVYVEQPPAPAGSQPPAQQPEAPDNKGGGSVIPDSLKKIPPKITTLPPARIPKIEKPTPIIPKLKPGVITPTPKPRVPIPTPSIPKPLIIKPGALR
jgi:hypothetical protein